MFKLLAFIISIGLMQAVEQIAHILSFSQLFKFFFFFSNSNLLIINLDVFLWYY